MLILLYICFGSVLFVFVPAPPSSLHGSPLLDAGLVTLNAALSAHPALVSLDLGDCMLGDEALRLVCGMLPPDGAKSGGCGPQCTWLWRCEVWRRRGVVVPSS